MDELSALLVLAASVPLALLMEGLHRKILARMQGRIGPPIQQPIYDTLKLVGKDGRSGNFLFKAAPWLALACAFFLFLFLPYSFISFRHDFIVYVYIFILLDTFFLIAGLATRSPFSLHAVVRELLLMIGFEITFLAVFGLFMVKSGSDAMSAYDSNFIALRMPLAAFILVYLGHVIVKVTPFDTVVADAEISGGLFTEYAGSGLAVLLLAEYMKNLAFYVAGGILLLGRSWWPLGALTLMFWYTLSQATSPRYTPLRSAKLFLVVACITIADLVFLI